MSNPLRFAPAPGLKVRDPGTGAWIPAEGIEIGPNAFDLHRMLAQGDLVEVTETPPRAAGAKKDA